MRAVAGGVQLRDVAERAGVSRTTASFVLNGRHVELGISEITRARVRRAAEELGYRCDMTERGRIIGLVSDAITSEPYAGEMVRGALAAALAHDRLLVIAETDGDRRTEDDLLRGMLDRQVSGLVYGAMFTQTVTVPAVLDQQPVVLLNCLADPLPGPAVVPDEVEGGRAAARGLLEAGHRENIYLVGERPRSLYAARARGRGIRMELARAGVRLAGALDCRWQPPDAYTAVRWFLRRTRPAALICLNDRVALGAYQALQESGLRVPDDVSVVSFDDSVLAAWLRPGLTSVALPHHEMGRLATDLLIKGDRHPAVHRVGMLLRSRGSIGPPRG